MLKVVEKPNKSPARVSVVFSYEVKPDTGELTAPQKLYALFSGRPMETVVRSHWSAYPSLRDAAVGLMTVIGTEWCASDSRPPLLVEAIEHATQEAVRVVQEDAASAREVVATYIASLTDAATEIAEYSTCGVRGTERVRWSPLVTTIGQWLAEASITKVEVEIGGKLNQDLLDGYRGNFLTRIATPSEVGMVLRRHF